MSFCLPECFSDSVFCVKLLSFWGMTISISLTVLIIYVALLDVVVDKVFGELAVLDREALSRVSAISSTAVELYCFESDILIALGARYVPNTMNCLKESMALHDPHEEKIAFYFKTKYNWSLRREKLMARLKL